jgi:hypothetical protein
MKNRIYTISAIILIIVLLYTYDLYRSKEFIIEVLEIVPNPAPADGETPVKIKVKEKRTNGKVVTGHNLYAVPLEGGSMRANRVQTNKNGEAEFIYFPYRDSPSLRARPINIQIIDESNSVFFEVNASTIATIKLVKPKTSGGNSGITTEDIFGE